ncbi:hypothetical protein Tco_0171757 [Tanacetum coccineum]
MAYSANSVRQTLLKRRQTELQAEVTLANKLSCELTRVAEQMRIREIHTTMLHAMPLTSLNTYGLHAFLMTHESDIRITHNLRTTRDDLLRSIDEKQKCIDNYSPHDVRLTVLMKLQEAIDEEAILEEQILALMHRFADRFTDRSLDA